MGVTMTTPMSEIRAYLEREAKKSLHQVIAILTYVGETVVNEIRTSDISEWNDQTGNLRSSIGYIISVDGVPTAVSKFEPVDGPLKHTTTEDGSANGMAYAQTLATLYPKGIALIVVAGMSYASYVEAMENKIVLAGGEIRAKQLVTEMLNRLKSGGEG